MSNYVQMEFDLRLSAEVGLARTYPRQAGALESSTETGPPYGKRCSVCAEMYTQRGLLRKMFQPCEVRDSHWSSKICARSGMWENFTVYPLPPVAALRTKGTESGSWPTPTCKPHRPDNGKILMLRRKVEEGALSIEDAQNMMPGMALFDERGVPPNRIPSWPTPQASDHRDRGNLSNPAIQRRLSLGKQLNLSMVVSPTSGQLNPQWVEWLMGYPDGWTDLSSLETP